MTPDSAVRWAASCRPAVAVVASSTVPDVAAYQEHEVRGSAEVRVDELCGLGRRRGRVVEAAAFQLAERARAEDATPDHENRRDDQEQPRTCGDELSVSVQHRSVLR